MTVIEVSQKTGEMALNERLPFYNLCIVDSFAQTYFSAHGSYLHTCFLKLLGDEKAECYMRVLFIFVILLIVKVIK